MSDAVITLSERTKYQMHILKIFFSAHSQYLYLLNRNVKITDVMKYNIEYSGGELAFVDMLNAMPDKLDLAKHELILRELECAIQTDVIINMLAKFQLEHSLSLGIPSTVRIYNLDYSNNLFAKYVIGALKNIQALLFIDHVNGLTGLSPQNQSQQ